MKASSDLSQEKNDSEVLEFLARARAQVDARLDLFVPSETVAPASLHGAIRWSLFAGGKRFRPALLLAVGSAFGAATNDLLAAACAFEMVHTYSLIHDDLPAMDDDHLRRGRATCHIRYDEATAILAGDALQTFAFQIIAEDETLAPSVRVQLIAELARASSTPYGMVAGQAQDIAAESRKNIAGDELDSIHRHKTGALITAAARSGAIIANATVPQLNVVTQYGVQLGLLFQITDDLLDVTATAEDLGKTPGKDARAQKVTYVSLYGLEASRTRARIVYDEACIALASLDKDTILLRAIARFILERRA
ncbi:MAG: polyprenyl synthetase family protein [Pyrinomonadaceae bacterium]